MIVAEGVYEERLILFTVLWKMRENFEGSLRCVRSEETRLLYRVENLGRICMTDRTRVGIVGVWRGFNPPRWLNSPVHVYRRSFLSENRL